MGRMISQVEIVPLECRDGHTRICGLDIKKYCPKMKQYFAEHPDHEVLFNTKINDTCFLHVETGKRPTTAKG